MFIVQGLFHRVIAQSGPLISNSSPMQVTEFTPPPFDETKIICCFTEFQKSFCLKLKLQAGHGKASKIVRKNLC